MECFNGAHPFIHSTPECRPVVGFLKTKCGSGSGERSKDHHKYSSQCARLAPYLVRPSQNLSVPRSESTESQLNEEGIRVLSELREPIKKARLSARVHHQNNNNTERSKKDTAASEDNVKKSYPKLTEEEKRDILSFEHLCRLCNVHEPTARASLASLLVSQPEYCCFKLLMLY